MAGACRCTAQIKGNHCGYWICHNRNKARLALDEAQHLTRLNWTSILCFSQERLVENPQLATARWSKQKYCKQTQVWPRIDPGQTWSRFKPAGFSWKLAWTEICQATLIKPFLRHQGQFTFEEMPHRQPQQDMVEFLEEARDAIRSFHAIQAGSCWSPA